MRTGTLEARVEENKTKLRPEDFEEPGQDVTDASSRCNKHSRGRRAGKEGQKPATPHCVRVWPLGQSGTGKAVAIGPVPRADSWARTTWLSETGTEQLTRAPCLRPLPTGW